MAYLGGRLQFNLLHCVSLGIKSVPGKGLKLTEVIYGNGRSIDRDGIRGRRRFGVRGRRHARRGESETPGMLVAGEGRGRSPAVYKAPTFDYCSHQPAPASHFLAHCSTSIQQLNCSVEVPGAIGSLLHIKSHLLWRSLSDRVSE